jgi:Flp pilus assembly protein TadG
MKSLIRRNAERDSERGQMLVMFTFFLVVLILFVGLGIDIGFAYVTKAELSKAVDAAALAGISSVNQGTPTAKSVASATFAANYGRPGRDTGSVNPLINFGTDSGNNQFITVDATATTRTFFVRILPTWKTMTVKSSAQATRAKVIMSVVLDHSTSMSPPPLGNGGSTQMPPAVTNFVNNFDDVNDRVSMVSFAQWATANVPVRTAFKAPIKTAVMNLAYTGPGGAIYYTGSEPGLTTGLAQNQSVVVTPGENVIKAIVFFTDGMANTFQYPFKCGAVTNNLNIDAWGNLYNPTNGATRTGCTIPTTISSINPPGTVRTSDCFAMHNEAEARAITIADQARQQGMYVYCIGLGDPNAPGECGNPVINLDFLRQVANDPDAGVNYKKNLPTGEALVTSDPAMLNELFQRIADRILLRLTL